MFKNWLVLCAAVAAILGNSGCGPTPLEKLDTHRDGPIIIDNPNAFIDLMPPTGHDSFLTDPVDQGNDKSTVIMTDHYKYQFIKLKGTDKDRADPYELSLTAVTVVFENHKNKKKIVDAGTMTIDWAQVSGLGSVSFASADKDYTDEAKKLRWYRMNHVYTKRLGLYAKQPGKHDYRVKYVEFSTGGNEITATRKTLNNDVKVLLCVTTDQCELH